MASPSARASRNCSRVLNVAKFTHARGALLVGCLLGFSGPAFASTDFPAPLVQVFAGADTGVNARTWITRQDRDGRLYFGADALVTYDGDRWQQFAIPGSAGLRGLDLGPDGKIWAAAADEFGWFDQNPAGIWIFHSLRSHLATTHDPVLGKT